MSSYYVSGNGVYSNSSSNSNSNSGGGRNGNTGGNITNINTVTTVTTATGQQNNQFRSQQVQHQHQHQQQQQKHHHHQQQQQTITKVVSSANRKLSYETATTTTISATSKYSSPSSVSASSTQQQRQQYSSSGYSSNPNTTEVSKIKMESANYHSQSPSTTVTNTHKTINNAHLLDHGYGASPQLPSSYYVRDIPGKIISNRNSEPTITDYYKQVKRRLPMTGDCISPTPSKQAKQSTAAVSVISTTPIQSQYRHNQQHHMKNLMTSKTMSLTVTTDPRATTTTANAIATTTLSKKRSPEGTRADTSLGILTKKFVDLLQESPDGVVDLNLASKKLEVQKRRIYDITNVLEGIGILEKKSKNNIQWKCGQSFVKSEAARQMELESKRLEQKENQLDSLIGQIRHELSESSDNDNYAYVTHHDLRSIDVFKDQVVIVIRAPAEAKLMLPNPKIPREIHLKAENNGEINVYLCIDSPENSPTFSHDPLFNDIKPLITPVLESTKKKFGTTYPFRSPQRNLNKSIMDAAAADATGSTAPNDNELQTSKCSMLSSSTIKESPTSDLSNDFIFPTTTRPVLTQSQVELLSGNGVGGNGNGISSSINNNSNGNSENIRRNSSSSSNSFNSRNSSCVNSSGRPPDYLMKQVKKEDIDTSLSSQCSSLSSSISITSDSVSTVMGGSGDDGIGSSISDNSAIIVVRDSTLPAVVVSEEDEIDAKSSSNSLRRAGMITPTSEINDSVVLSRHSSTSSDSDQECKTGTRNALISNTNTINLSPGILTQNPVEQSYLDDLVPFFPIEAPLDLDYNFSLAPTEGLTDLFDFV